ncbi:hypothetical protein [Enterococcus sp. AZ109]|uniref:hypothetical protein n=1 Tax=Enterococcus sp. AZ109 TaxID=2774634 RepID=UPI003F22E389
MTDIVNQITKSDVIIAAMIGLFGIIISAVVSYIVAKVQSKSTERNLKAQLESEIKKIELQYEMQKSLDNHNFINRLLLEKMTELQHEYNKWIQVSKKDAEIHLELTQSYKCEFDKEIELGRIIEENRKKRIELTENVDVLVNYFPDLKSVWDDAKSYSMEMITNTAKVGSERTESYSSIMDFHRITKKLNGKLGETLMEIMDSLREPS